MGEELGPSPEEMDPENNEGGEIIPEYTGAVFYSVDSNLGKLRPGEELENSITTLRQTQEALAEIDKSEIQVPTELFRKMIDIIIRMKKGKFNFILSEDFLDVVEQILSGNDQAPAFDETESHPFLESEVTKAIRRNQLDLQKEVLELFIGASENEIIKAFKDLRQIILIILDVQKRGWEYAPSESEVESEIELSDGIGSILDILEMSGLTREDIRERPFTVKDIASLYDPDKSWLELDQNEQAVVIATMYSIADRYSAKVKVTEKGPTILVEEDE